MFIPSLHMNIAYARVASDTSNVSLLYPSCLDARLAIVLRCQITKMTLPVSNIWHDHLIFDVSR